MAVVGALMLPCAVFAQNLIQNGDFATQDFTGWTRSGNLSYTSVSCGGSGAQICSAGLGPVGSPGFLSQVFYATSGHFLKISYDFMSDGATPSVFQVSFNGTYLFNQNNGPAIPFTNYYFYVQAAAQNTLQFGFQDDPGFQRLANVVAVDVGANAPGPLGQPIENSTPPATNITAANTNASGLGSSPATVLPVFDGGTLVNDGTALNNYGFTITGNGGTIDLAGQNATIATAIANAEALTPGNMSVISSVPGGVLVLSAANTYTGTTTIGNGAALALSGAGSIASSTALVDDGSFDISGTAAGASLQRLSGSGTVILGGHTLTLTDAADTFAGAISGSGGVTVAGGTETLSGANAYTGATGIDHGAVLRLAGNGTIAASSGLVDNGTFDISASNGASIRSLSGSGTVILGSQTLALSNAADTFTGTIGGSGALAVVGGAERLTGVNAYTGATTIADGATLSLADAGAIWSSSGVANNGTFDISATDAGAEIKTLSGSGAVALGGQTLTLTSAHDTFAGTIAGTGSVSIIGGTERLTGNNTYAGGTDIWSGSVLKVSADRNLGAASGQVRLNDGRLQTLASFATGRDFHLTNIGTIDVASGSTLTDTTGTVSGSGTLNKAGDGTLILGGALSQAGGLRLNGGTLALSGNNSYTGGTVINSGTLQVSADRNLGAAGSNITLNGGRLQATDTFESVRAVKVSASSSVDTVSQGTTLTLNGKLTGTGRLFKDGAGTLVLAGDNAGGAGAQNVDGIGWTGGLTVNSGLVKVTNAYGLGWGSVMLNGGQINTTVDILTGQTIGVGDTTIINTDANTTTTLTGNITSTGIDSCFVKSGQGTLNVAGRAHVKATCILEGKLLANGLLDGSVTVEQGSTLGGAGMISGPVTVHGTLSPGNSPGMLTAAATVTMAAGSTYKEDINGTTQASAFTPVGVTGYYSYVYVAGNNRFAIEPGVTLAPALTNLFSASEAGYGTTPFTPSIGQNYRIVTAEGGITGRFAVIAQPDGMDDNTRFAAFYNVDGANSIDLKVVPSSYLKWIGGANANIRSAAAALDRIADADQSATATTAQSRLFLAAASQSAGTLAPMIKGLAGEVHGALAMASAQAGWDLQKSVDKQVGAGARPERGIWGDLTGNHGQWRSDDRASGFTANRTQLTFGSDVMRGGDSRIGVGFSYAKSDVSADLGSGKLYQSTGFLYGQVGTNALKLDGLLSHGRNRVNSNRADPTGITANAITAHADGTSSMLALGVRAPSQSDGAVFEPFARVSVQHVVRDAARETGTSPAALALDGYSATGTRVTLGLAGASAKTDPMAAQATYRLSLGVGVDGGKLLRTAQGASLAGIKTTITGPDVGRVFVQAGVHGTAQLTRQSYVYFGLNGEARERYSDIGGNIGLRASF